MLPKPDTIAAIATAPGKGGIGVVRISGARLAVMAHALLGKTPVPRSATYAPFLDAQGQTLDQGVALFFPAPHSYTGEDVLELQGHGGTAVLQLLLKRCLELGARLAEPGEFTLRAFLNGKLDLAQAEGVADLIGATTDQGARSAMRSLQGEFSSAVRGLLDGLVKLRMLVEAMLDFPEEELDTSDVMLREGQLGGLLSELERILNLAQQGSLLREGAHVVLVGQPNVGKSSLLNRLSGEEVALVSEIPGTTRDVIRQAIHIGGVPLHIMDTAGLRETQDAVELMGVERTHGAIQKADAILLLMEAGQVISAQDKRILADLPRSTPRLRVFNKIDLCGIAPHVETSADITDVYVSAKTGAGLDLMRRELQTLIGWHQESGVFMARERHLRALRAARELLQQALKEAGRAELLAENLRLAQEQLNSITGDFSADDLLGEIFSRFCIGK